MSLQPCALYANRPPRQMVNTSNLWIKVHRLIFLKYTEVLDLVYDRYIQILHIQKLRHSIDYLVLVCVGKFLPFQFRFIRRYHKTRGLCPIFVTSVEKSHQQPVRMLFFIVWPNLHNKFLFECLTISGMYIYQLKISQLEDRLLFMFD